MLSGEEPALFVTVGRAPDGELALPATSARAAAQVARPLTEYYPHTRAGWQVNPHSRYGSVVVSGGGQHLTGKHPLDQDAHAFLLAPGKALPPVWVALCGQRIGHAEFDTLD